MNLDDPIEVIRWALRTGAVIPTAAGERCRALADDPTLGGLVATVNSKRADWPPPQPGDHEVDLDGVYWGPFIDGLPGTTCDDTWFAARQWSRSNPEVTA